MKSTICFTGHRPQSFGGFDETIPEIRFVKDELRSVIEKAVKKGFTKFISGGALGVDQWAAEIVIELKKNNPNLKLTIARPFPSQDGNWIEVSKMRYQRILSSADDVVDVSEDPFTAEKMQIRNQWMVDNSSVVIAVWNGKSGGTGNCMKYARKKGKAVYRINPDNKQSAWISMGSTDARD